MTDPIQTICNLTDCSIEDAKIAYDETGNVVDAVDKLLIKVVNVSDKYTNKPKKQVVLTEEQAEIANVRKLMKENDDRMYNPIVSSQYECEELDEMQDHHEETVLQNNCSQECQLPSLQSEAQIQEIVCQSQSESTCDLQLNDQI
jgi:hypothetical protein